MSKHIMLLTALAAVTGQAAAQDLNCRGVSMIQDPPSILTLDIVRRDSVVTLRHARVEEKGVTHATNSVAGGVLTLTIDEPSATLAMPMLRGPGRVRTTWTRMGKATPVTLNCQPVAPLTDNAPHTVRMIRVETDVKIEVLDFGGSGRPVILLHGLSATAHDFDQFAPKLAATYRVVALTRRGFGRSSVPDTGYAWQRLADDVLAVADSLGLVNPVVAGHSLGGADLSAIAARMPERIAGLIYLDAGMPYAYIDSARVAGFETKPEDLHKCPCSAMEQIENGSRLFQQIPSRVLAIYAMDPGWEQPNYSGASPWTKAQQSREFEKGVPTARVVRIPNAQHYVFESNEAEVLSEMRAFINGLPPARR